MSYVTSPAFLKGDLENKIDALQLMAEALMTGRDLAVFALALNAMRKMVGLEIDDCRCDEAVERQLRQVSRRFLEAGR